jgi:hypothetical protein
MKTAESKFENRCAMLGLSIPELYLPAENVDVALWPVVACDQYTSQPEYWQQTEAIVADNPSTLKLILPELYLDHPGEISVESRIKTVNQAMNNYLEQGIIRKQQPGCILLDRQTPLHPSRKGLIIAVDLEQYDFTPGNKKLISATEGTVLERIPPRQAIRRNASLELPHVQLLIDDPQKTVIEPLWSSVSSDKPLYNSELMQGGGHIRGWFIDKHAAALRAAVDALAALPTYLSDNLLFAVGDGNHSLATAQAHWNEIKAEAGDDHPARYALVEIINIHDEGLEFEPIHRAIFGIDTDNFLSSTAKWLTDFSKHEQDSTESIQEILPVFAGSNKTELKLAKAPGQLTAAIVQQMLDELVPIWRGNGMNVRIDYIHGNQTVIDLAAKGACGIILPPFAKSTFFEAIMRDGILPRKTFSMGEAFEKRYYFEARRIVRNET